MANLRWPPLWWSAPLKRRTVASLFRQNRTLRDNIDIEFKAAAAASAYPRFQAEMEAYRLRLMEATVRNDEALLTLFGAYDESIIDKCRALLDDSHGVYDGLGSVWRHVAKDWTSEGAAAAGTLRERVIGLVAEEAPASVLVPGCGQARLAWELAERLPAVHVTGLEVSTAQLQVARHMLGCTERASLAFHPFLDEPRNAADESTRAVELRAPDVAPGGGGGASRLRLEQTDFDGWRATSPAPVECVVTSFFLDCLPDPVAALEAVHASLAPGGLWVCAGPLAYHHWPMLSPTLTQLRTLSAEVGLRPLGEAELIAAPYVRAPRSLRHDADWTAAVWVARKE